MTAGDLDRLPGLLTELRELVREAHAAIKDLTPLIREHRRIAEDGARDLLARIEETVNAELRRVEAHLQAEQNTASAELNQAVGVAREHIVSCLTPDKVSIAPDGHVQFTFKGNFQEDAQPARNRRRHRSP